MSAARERQASWRELLAAAYSVLRRVHRYGDWDAEFSADAAALWGEIGDYLWPEKRLWVDPNGPLYHGALLTLAKYADGPLSPGERVMAYHEDEAWPATVLSVAGRWALVRPDYMDEVPS